MDRMTIAILYESQLKTLVVVLLEAVKHVQCSQIVGISYSLCCVACNYSCAGDGRWWWG